MLFLRANKAFGQWVSVGHDLKERQMPPPHCPQVTRQPCGYQELQKQPKTLEGSRDSRKRKCWRSPELGTDWARRRKSLSHWRYQTNWLAEKEMRFLQRWSWKIPDSWHQKWRGNLIIRRQDGNVKLSPNWSLYTTEFRSSEGQVQGEKLLGYEKLEMEWEASTERIRRLKKAKITLT